MFIIIGAMSSFPTYFKKQFLSPVIDGGALATNKVILVVHSFLENKIWIFYTCST